jgi:tetratricopeptide (TPR) repeat protein
MTVNCARFATFIVASLATLIFCGCSVEAKKARHLQRAEHYFNSGEYEKAKVEYLNVLRFAFKEPRAMRQLGLIWLAEGEPLRAYPYLLQTRDLIPDDLDIRTKLAAVLSALGELKGAREQALAALQVAPGNEEALLVLADSVRNDGDVQQVQEQLRKTPEDRDLAYHLAWATLASRSGDFTYVKSELEQALATDPRSARAHAMMAALYASQGERAEADREFRAAIWYSPPGSGVCLEYARFQADGGARDKARAILTETLKLAPHYQAARALLAQIAFDEGKFDEALGLLENVLDVDFANVDALILQAQVWLAKGETKQAAESMESLDLSYPNVPFIKYELAKAYTRNNQLTQALVALDQAISEKPDYIDAVLLRSEIQLRTGNPSMVVPELVSLLKQQPGLRQARMLLAEAYRLWGRLNDAVAVIRDEIQDSPQSPDGYLSLGLVFGQQQRFAEAKQAYEKAAQLSPDDLTAFDRIIELNIATDNFAVAMEHVKRQLAKTPQSAVAQFAEAKVYAAQNDWIRAEPALFKTIELDPNLSAAYQLLVFDYVASGRIEPAIGQLQTMVATNPRDERALMTLALIYEKKEDYAKARGTYEKLLALNPSFTGALNNLSYLYAEKFKDPQKAYELARKARLKEPTNPVFADTLGWALYKQGNYQEALNLIQESARASSNDPKVQFHFGMASYMMGALDDARMAFKKAVAGPLDSYEKQEAKRWLAYIEDDRGTPKQLSVTELETLLRQRPNDVIARVRLGALYEKQGAISKAAEQYESAISANPKLSDPMIRLALLYAGPLHDLQKALELAKAAREVNDSPQTIAVLGQVAYQTGQFEWAYSLLQSAARAMPDDTTVICNLAWSAYALGKTQQAHDVVNNVLKSHQLFDLPTAGQWLFVLTDSKSAQAEKWETEVQKALRSDPNDLSLLATLGRLQFDRGQSAAAIESFSKILQRFPDFVPAQKALADLYLSDSAKLAEAYELALKAHSAAPDDPDTTRVLVEASYRKNQYSDVLQLLQKSAAATPLDARALYYLGMSHFRLDHAEGREYLERALSAGLKEPLASEAKRTLARLAAGKTAAKS